MSKDIYPLCGRLNNLSYMYCEMAMEAYYLVSKWSGKIKDKNYSALECEKEWNDLTKEVVKTVVFSAMAIEAFLNDYAAACLGDSEFYGSFDQLSPISKFELIAKFILGENVDKSKAYYCHLKKLVQNRNTFVHNKSSAINGYETLEEAIEAREPCESEPLIDARELKEDVTKALDALKAVRDIALFFDKYDSNVYAVKRLFGIWFQFYKNPAQQYKLYTLNALRIKFNKD